MPKRGPAESLILFQLLFGAAFLSMVVWTILAWAGVF
jgi:predicted phage tail protein